MEFDSQARCKRLRDHLAPAYDWPDHEDVGRRDGTRAIVHDEPLRGLTDFVRFELCILTSLAFRLEMVRTKNNLNARQS